MVYFHQPLVQHYEREQSYTNESICEALRRNLPPIPVYIPFTAMSNGRSETSTASALRRNQCHENQVSDCPEWKHCFPKLALGLGTWSQSSCHFTGAKLFVDSFHCLLAGLRRSQPKRKGCLGCFPRSVWTWLLVHSSTALSLLVIISRCYHPLEQVRLIN